MCMESSDARTEREQSKIFWDSTYLVLSLEREIMQGRLLLPASTPTWDACTGRTSLCLRYYRDTVGLFYRGMKDFYRSMYAFTWSLTHGRKSQTRKNTQRSEIRDLTSHHKKSRRTTLQDHITNVSLLLLLPHHPLPTCICLPSPELFYSPHMHHQSP